MAAAMGSSSSIFTIRDAAIFSSSAVPPCNAPAIVSMNPSSRWLDTLGKRSASPREAAAEASFVSANREVSTE